MKQGAHHSLFSLPRVGWVALSQQVNISVHVGYTISPLVHGCEDMLPKCVCGVFAVRGFPHSLQWLSHLWASTCVCLILVRPDLLHCRSSIYYMCMCMCTPSTECCMYVYLECACAIMHHYIHHCITISQISVLSRQSLCLVHVMTNISVATYLPACSYPLVSVWLFSCFVFFFSFVDCLCFCLLQYVSP